MKKILIFGDGQIGNFYLHFFNSKGDRAQIAKNVDIRKFNQVEEAIEDYKPTVVINTAAITNLEWCGNNRLEAFDVNVLGAATLAKACDEKDVYFVHFSSGCIFSSKNENDAKKEDDQPEPMSYYSFTKVWSEQMVNFERSPNFKCLVLRPRQPVSGQLSPKNMLVKMLTFNKFIDTPNSGTVIEDLMDWTDQLLDKQVTGVVHAANIGFTNPYNISHMIKKYILPELQPIRISKMQLDEMTPNIRVDTVLNVEKLTSLGIKVMPYEERLDEIVKKLGESIKSADKAELKSILEETAAATRQRSTTNNLYESLYS